LLPVAITSCQAGDYQQRHDGNHQPAICASCVSHHVFVFVHSLVLLHVQPPQFFSWIAGVATPLPVRSPKECQARSSPIKYTLFEYSNSKDKADLGVLRAPVRHGLSMKCNAAREAAKDLAVLVLGNFP